MAREPIDPSGIDVYPKMPVPKAGRASDARIAGFGGGDKRAKLKLAGIVAGSVALGGGAGFFARPTHGADLARANTELADAQKSATSQKERADGLDAQL